MIAGVFVDQACLIWQKVCDTTGSCLLYDVTRLRYSIVGVTMISYCFGLVMLALGVKMVGPGGKENEAKRESIPEDEII